MTREELEMRTLVRESDVIDRTDGSELAKAFNHLWEKYVEQESRTGHWIFDDKCKEHGHCSRCGYGSVDLVDGEPHNFCRNCGCRMVGSQESEEV